MIEFRIILALFIFSLSFSLAQNKSDTLITRLPDNAAVTISLQNDTISANYGDSVAVIKKHFDSFEYGDVIKSANRLLTQRDSLSKDNLIQVYRMKGSSHFSLTEDQAAKESFVEIVKIDTSFSMDSAKTSPKIISLFNDVKKEYIRNLQAQQENVVIKVDTVFIPVVNPTLEAENHVRKAFFYSIFYPGAGHIYDDRLTKGWILSTLTTISIGSLIYHMVDTNKKEKLYLNERNPLMIEARYSSYNESYRYRSISFLTLAAVWLYSQLDLLWFSKDGFSNLEIKTKDSGLNSSEFTLNFKLNF
jgi:hypothetical protein